MWYKPVLVRSIEFEMKIPQFEYDCEMVHDFITALVSLRVASTIIDIIVAEEPLSKPYTHILLHQSSSSNMVVSGTRKQGPLFEISKF